MTVRQWVGGIFAMGLIAGACHPHPNSSPSPPSSGQQGWTDAGPVTKAHFDSITDGMSLGKVKDLLGEPTRQTTGDDPPPDPSEPNPQSAPYNLTAYVWEGVSTTDQAPAIYVVFLNGKEESKSSENLS